MKKPTVILLSVSFVAGVWLLAGGNGRVVEPGAGVRHRGITRAGAARHSDVESGTELNLKLESRAALEPEPNATANVSGEPSVAVPETGIANTSAGTPGNSLTFAGRRVAVEAFSRHPDGAAMDLVITALATAAGSSANGAVERRAGPGLTYEQELFRTKWGWAAFEQAQRAARDEAASSMP